MSENKNEASLWKKIFNIVFPSFVSLINVIFIIAITDNNLKIFLLTVVNIAAIIIIITLNFALYKSSEYMDYKKNRKYYDNLNLSFYVKEFNKEVIILKTDGTAKIKMKYKLKNISDRSFNSIKKRLRYDGQFLEDSFSLQVEDEHFDWKRLNLVSNKPIVSKTVKEEFGSLLTIPIPMKDSLRPKHSALIVFQYSITKVFSDAFKEGKSDSTSMKVVYPVDKFKLKIKLKNEETQENAIKEESVEDFIFVFKKIKAEIDTIKTRDSREELRAKEENKVNGDLSNELSWEISNPKIGNSYSLYFSCKKNR